MPSRYDVNPVNMQPALEGISRIGTEYRQNTERDRLSKDVGDALNSGDYEKLTEMAVQYPNLIPNLKNLAGFKSDATRQMYGEGLGSVLTTMENMQMAGDDGSVSYPSMDYQAMDEQGAPVGEMGFNAETQDQMLSLDAQLADAEEKITQAGGSPNHIREARQLAAEGKMDEAYRQARTGLMMGNPELYSSRYGDASSAGDNTGFGAKRRLGVDADGNKFWVGTKTNTGTGAMETVFAPIAHKNKVPAEGGIEFIDNEFGLTSKEDMKRKADAASLKLRETNDSRFYNNYIPEVRAIEGGVKDLERTQEYLNDLSGQADYSSTGFGSWMRGIPLTDANRWSQLKSTVQSRLAMDKMMQLKSASSTGSTGFGALSEKELKILTDHLGSLEQAQSPKEIKRVIGRIYNTLEDTKKVYRKKMEQNYERYKGLYSKYNEGSEMPVFIEDKSPNIETKQTGSGITYTVE